VSESAPPPGTPLAPPPESDEDEHASPFGWFPIIMLVLLVGGGLFVMFQMHHDDALQDCVQSGRKNCAPIDTTNPSP
jgi:hypothetical protein